MVEAGVVQPQEHVDDVLVLAAAVTARSVGQVDAAAALLRAADRLHALAIARLTDADEDPAARAVGLGVEGCVREDAHRTGPEARLLVAASERLQWLPTIAELLARGAVSWSTVRAVVAQTRHLTVEQLGWVDRAVAADTDGFCRCDADGQVAAVAELADRARPDLHKGKEQRRYERSFLSLQPGFDGSLQVYGEFDPEAGAAILERLDAPGAGETEINSEDPDQPEPDPAGVSGWGRSKGARQAERLHQACVHRCRAGAVACDCDADADDDQGDDQADADDDLGGTSGGGSGFGRARPSLLVLTPVDRLAEDVCSSSAAHLAQLLWRTARGPVSLSDAAVQRLACDATLRQVLTDGHDVLGVAAPTESIPTRVRAALWARDAGCRFPGCKAPAQWTDGHHVRWRSKGGPTTLENLVLLRLSHGFVGDAQAADRSSRQPGLWEGARAQVAGSGWVSPPQLQQVVGCADQAPLAVHGGQAATVESTVAEVVLDVAEDGLDAVLPGTTSACRPWRAARAGSVASPRTWASIALTRW